MARGDVVTVAELIEILAKLPPDTTVMDEYDNEVDLKNTTYHPVKGVLHLRL